LVSWLVSIFLFAAHPSEHDPLQAYRRARSRAQKAAGALAKAATIAVGVITPAMMLLAFVAGSFGTYHVLTPRSPDGCTVVVGAWSALAWDNNSGNVYVVDPWSTDLHEVASDLNLSSYDPIGLGDWSLLWNGRDGVLRLQWHTIPIHCPPQ